MTCPPRRLRPASVRRASRRARPDRKECDVDVSGLKRFRRRLLDDEPAVLACRPTSAGGERADLSVPSFPQKLDRHRSHGADHRDARLSTDGLLGVASEPVAERLNRALDFGGHDASRCAVGTPTLGTWRAARTRFRRRESVLVLSCPCLPGGPMRFGSRQATPDARDSPSMLDPRQAVFDRTRILIADDDRKFAEMLQAALSLHEEFEVVAIVGDGAEAVVGATELRPQVVLMDVGMPKLDGIEATRRIRELSDPPLVILITGENPRATGENAYDAGAAAYLLKSRDLPNLIDAILTCTRLSAALSTIGAAPTVRVSRS